MLVALVSYLCSIHICSYDALLVAARRELRLSNHLNDLGSRLESIISSLFSPDDTC
jgi:hypothetical protein